MRRITTAIMSTITVLVLLFSYRTSLGATAATASDTMTTPDEPGSNTSTQTGASATPTTAPVTTPSAAPTTSTPDPTASDSTGSTSTDGTFAGDSVPTRFGPVQVQVTVAGGQLVDVHAIDYPNSDRHDQRINAYAIPVLNDEALQARSAQIDAVSGATITSDAYIESLQSALDAAHL